MIVSSLSDLIGNTPILRIVFREGDVELFIKLESLNPCGSMKDRMALSMLNDVENESGKRTGLHIVESSSGNTATALAMLCAERGHQFTAIMDTHAATDKIRAVQALGGKVRVVGGASGELVTAERDALAHEIAEANEDTFCTAQHDNPTNADGYRGLAQELVCQIGTDINVLCAAIGTGGSLCGTSRELKRLIPSIRTVGVEPIGSIIFGGPAQSYLQSGTGTPEGASVGLVIDYEVIDEGRKVADSMAFATCRVLAKRYGLLVGGSAGGAIYEAIRLCLIAKKGAKVVTFACDSGTKYMDSIFSDTWLERHFPDIADGIADIDHIFSQYSDCLDRKRK